MNHAKIEEELVVERYLLGRLSPRETEEFEDHYLSCPDCLERLELTQRLRDGTREAAAVEVRELTRLAVLSSWSRRLRLGLGLAALILIALPWVLLTPRLDRLEQRNETLVAELETSRTPRGLEVPLVLGLERDASGRQSPSARVTLGPRPEWVALALELPPGVAARSYRARLSSTDGGQTATIEALRPGPDGRLTLLVHSSGLATPIQRIDLEAARSDGSYEQLGRFAFRVDRSHESTEP